MNVAALSKIGALDSNVEMNTGLIKLGTTKLSPEGRDKFLAVKAKLGNQTEHANAELSGEVSPSPKCVEIINPASQIGGLVICQICGETFKRITHWHVECKHDITLEHYRALFPLACVEGKSWRDGQRAKRIAQGDAWNRGLTKDDPRVAGYASKLKGKPKSEEHCRALSRVKKELCKNPEYALKTVSNIDVIARNVRPTKLELRMEAILDKYFPKQWKYVGNGELALGRLKPDFMNIVGKKQLIEVYGDYWHRNHNPQDKIDRLKKFGFSTLVVWGKELKNEDQVLETIKKFLWDDDMTHPITKVVE